MRTIPVPTHAKDKDKVEDPVAAWVTGKVAVICLAKEAMETEGQEADIDPKL